MTTNVLPSVSTLNTLKDKEELTSDGFVTSIIATILRGEVISSGLNPSKPDPKFPDRTPKLYALDFYLVSEIEKGGRMLPDRKMIKITSDIEPPPAGVYSLAINQGKIDGGPQWYSLICVLDEKLPLVEVLKKFKKPAKKAKEIK